MKESKSMNNESIKTVTSIYEVGGDGPGLLALAVEFGKEVVNSELSDSDFNIPGKSIKRVYANNEVSIALQGVDGKYVIIELEEVDTSPPRIASYIKNREHFPGQVKQNKIALIQFGEIKTADGSQYPPSPDPIENTHVKVLLADEFTQHEFKDPRSGITLKYNLFVPRDYDRGCAYPLVLFIHDAGVVGDDPQLTLLQGLGGVVWAEPSEQEKRPCIVLAPQYSKIIVNDASEATEELEVTVNLIKALQDQYHIDQNRVYTTGQSMGCMSSVEMMIRYPNLFAAALLVAGQWDAGKMSVLTDTKMWVVVAEGDQKAFPGMNASMAALEEAGAQIDRAFWDGRSSSEEFAAEVDKMIALGNGIKYTALNKGSVVPEGVSESGPNNHMHTWPIVYTIEGLRGWLFSQSRDMEG